MSRKLSFSAVLKGDALAYVSMLAFRDPKSFCCRSASSSFRILVSDCFFSPMRSCSPGAELYRKLCGRPLIFSNISKVVCNSGLPAPPGIFWAFPISSQPTRFCASSLLSERLLTFFIFVSPLVLGVLGVFVLGFLFSFGGFGGFYNNISTRLLLGCGDS